MCYDEDVKTVPQRELRNHIGAVLRQVEAGARLRVTVDGRPAPVVAWSGPWPARERWWDPPHARRRAHFQLVTATAAYLLTFENGHWHTEAIYD